ncbi:hypothetical protein [Halomicrobium salinisoli]|uniref:hypothetical protein n=1 Tax=Halomicrobium salinisoli TaxID=2878391 RepID=UPI001CF036B2|nr:hypothetical protein [Halomicrobium salinisoli]
MVGFSSPFGGGQEGDDDLFDDYDAFVPATIPDPGRFLEGHDVLTGDEHLDFHDLTREVFEERSVYDMTFGYNLARLNLDTRHRDAGYRYAYEQRSSSPGSQARQDAVAAGSDEYAPDDVADDAGEDFAVLRAEFTPTTPFCPQSDTLTVGSFRAWNGLADRHDYDLVRVRVAEMHHRADEINERLAALEASFRETGSVEGGDGARDGDGGPQRGGKAGCSQGTGGSTRGYGADAPF